MPLPDISDKSMIDDPWEGRWEGTIKFDVLTPEKKIELIRNVIDRHQYQKVISSGRKEIIDATTANVIITVYDALNETNKKKFASMTYQRMADIAWKLVK